MIFDEKLQKGVRRRSIPPPLNISLPCSAPYDTLIKKGRENFFPDDTSSDDLFCLADSNGIPYEVEDKSDWVLSEFIQQIGQPPSKLRLYVMCRMQVTMFVVIPTTHSFSQPLYTFCRKRIMRKKRNTHPVTMEKNKLPLAVVHHL